MEYDSQNITGIILAGGQSSRMGSEKGLVTLNGKTFINHIINAMKPLVKELIIVSNAEVYDFLGYKRVEDIIKNAGPLAGLFTGLYHSNTNKNLVVSCDVPLITSEILKLLTENTFSEQDVVQCQSQEKIMPLVALYKRQCKDICLELLDKGERRLMELSKVLKTKTIVLDPSLEKFVQNINTKEQLKMIQNEYTA